MSYYLKCTNPEQAETIYSCKNTKQKLYKTYAVIWYNKVCRINQVTFNWQYLFNCTRTSLTRVYLRKYLPDDDLLEVETCTKVIGDIHL